MKPKIKNGAFVKLKIPEFAANYNQGPAPLGLALEKHGDRIIIKWGTVLKVCANTENGIGNFGTGKQYDEIDMKFLLKNIDEFEII